MKKALVTRLIALLLLLAFTQLLPSASLAAEGDPLLSVEDLLSLEQSYSAFLDDLENLIVARGLLSQEDRAAWRDAQMGDFFQNGGYGSILASYMPGALSLAREEETMVSLQATFENGATLEVNTMRRYTPLDSSLPGLMLTLNASGADGAPLDVAFTLHATSGLFLKWDVLLGTYQSVGFDADSEGETLIWSDQPPVQDARNPQILLTVSDAGTQQPVGTASLTLTVDGASYLVRDDALAPAP